MAGMAYDAVIGLEIHAQLPTDSKMFCGCRTGFGAAPNTWVCPVCLGLPGALPVPNARAIDYAVRAALALGCRIHSVSVFARKNYFYPDLPKGYQISQYERPLATGGALAYTTSGREVRVGITRVHLEEDAGKSLHEGLPDSDRRTQVDFNRSGVPLIEIVTEPDLRSARDAAGFFERLRGVLVAIGVNDGNMEEGNLRCDANVSVRPVGETALGTKTEVKNLNSFRFLQRALDFEISRQIGLLEAGDRVRHETRLWDVRAGETVVMRSKEEAHDYRYFPEPDLLPIETTAARIEAARAAIPELPEARKDRYVTVFEITEADAALLAADVALGRYFEATARESGNPRAAAHWTLGDLTRKMKEERTTIDDVRVAPGLLAGLIRLADEGTISGPTAKAVFEQMWNSGRPAEELVREQGLGQVSDAAALEALVRQTLVDNPRAVAQYRAGKTLAFGFFVGQVMKATRGTANPALVNDLLRRALDAGKPE
jgi:aspartyl-tRNA(Asn)/glutamyl-tRNA(Gln) amidotransferase subunit B